MLILDLYWDYECGVLMEIRKESFEMLKYMMYVLVNEEKFFFLKILYL